MILRRVVEALLLLGLAAVAGCRSVDPWIDIDDPEMEWRAKAAMALGHIDEEEPERVNEAAALLERRWDNEGRGEQVPLVRFAIIEGFTVLGTDRAPRILMEGLADPEPLVRESAARAIGRLGLTGKRGALIARLEKDSSPEVRATIASALAEIEDPGGEPSLMAVPALIERLDDTPIVSIAAHVALQQLTFQPLERDSDEWDRWWRRWNAAAPGDRK